MNTETFLSKCEPVTESGCWIWLGNHDRKTNRGYANKSGKTRLAARVSYEIFIGPIPKGLFVCHKCDVPACVNPNHLFVGTNQDNMRDMQLKGRAKGRNSGIKNFNAKLNWTIVSEIRNNRFLGVTHAENAKKYGVDQSNISRICSGAIWNERYKP